MKRCLNSSRSRTCKDEGLVARPPNCPRKAQYLSFCCEIFLLSTFKTDLFFCCYRVWLLNYRGSLHILGRSFLIPFFHSVSTFSFIIIIFKCLFIFGHAGFSVLLGLFLSCSEQLLSRPGARASHCGGFSCCRAQALASTHSVISVHGLSCSEARGIFPDQGLNPCLLHWQVDCLPPSHQGSPCGYTLDGIVYNTKVLFFFLREWFQFISFFLLLLVLLVS